MGSTMSTNLEGSSPCFSSPSLHLNKPRRGRYRLMQTLQSFINRLWAESGAEAKDVRREQNQQKKPWPRCRLDGRKGTTRRTCLLQTGLLCPYILLLSSRRTPICPLHAPCADVYFRYIVLREWRERGGSVLGRMSAASGRSYLQDVSQSQVRRVSNDR